LKSSNCKFFREKEKSPSGRRQKMLANPPQAKKEVENPSEIRYNENE
jgi:hypothetical protein